MKRKFIVVTSLIIMLFFASNVYAFDKNTLFVKETEHVFNIEFNVPVHEIYKGAITFTDDRGVLLPFRLEQDVAGRNIKIYPGFSLEPGKFYKITVHKGKLTHNSVPLKESYEKTIALDFDKALELAWKIHDQTYEGGNLGNVGYGAKSEFRKSLLKLTSENPKIKSEFEKNLWTRELGNAISAFNVSKNMKSTGEVICNLINCEPSKDPQKPDEIVCKPLPQSISSISFNFKFLTSTVKFIENNLSGFELAVDYNSEKRRIFISKNLFKNVSEVPDTHNEETQYEYRNIDATELLRGLPVGDYYLKIKPVFKNIDPDTIFYSKDSAIQLLYQPNIEGKEIKFLSWINFLEISEIPGALRYEVDFESPYNIEKFALTNEDFQKSNNAKGYLFKPLNSPEKLYWNIGEYPQILSFLKNGSNINVSVRYYDSNNKIIGEIQKVPISFITDELPQITSIYNLSKVQEESLLSPDFEYKIAVINKGDILSMESSFPAKLHIFKIMLKKESSFNWEIILRDHVENIRYLNYGDGLYKDFREKLLNTEGRLLITEVPTVTEKTDAQNLIHLDTSRLAEGQYFMVIEDNHGLYYPIENIVFNLTEKKDLNLIQNEGYKDGSILFNYCSIDNKLHNISAFVLNENQYLEFLNHEDLNFLNRLMRNGMLIAQSVQKSVKNGDEISLKLKDIPSNENLYIVVFEGDYYDVKKIFFK